MKKMTFLVGLAAGMALSQYWRPLTKGGIKVGIRAGRKVKELSQQALEDIEDLTVEAAEELSEQDQEET